MAIAFGSFIVVGLLILAYDRFVVKRDAPDPQVELATVSQKLGLTLGDPYLDAHGLRDAVSHFPELAPALGAVGPVLERKDESHTLRVYEHRQDATAVRTKLSRHNVEIRRLAVVLEVPGAELSPLTVNAAGQASDGAMLPEQVAARMRAWGEFSFAVAGDLLFFIQDPPSSALVSAVERGQSPEFQPGLLNSGLAIDIQRALDIANMLLPEGRALPPVFKVDVGDIAARLPQRKLDLKLEQNVTRTKEKLDALRKEREAKWAAYRAEQAERQEAMRTALTRRLHGDDEPDGGPQTPPTDGDGAAR